MISRSDLDASTRREVLVRDEYKCILCHKRGVQVHEIIPRSALGKNKSEFLFSIRNRVSLCPECHAKAHTRQERQKAFDAIRKYNYEYTNQEKEMINRYGCTL